MKQYFGIIEIGDIQNIPADGPEGGKQAEVKFVHYPDCQQLIIWLAEYGRNYGSVRFTDRKTSRIFKEHSVADILNGSIQLLFDTLDLPPGEYSIEIDHPKGWKHLIEITKFKKGYQTPKPPPPEVDEALLDRPPIVYRDGFGNILPNEDLIMRDNFLKELADKFLARIEYEGNFRSGTVIYIDGETRISFTHEMGGGNCMLYIDIPDEKAWEAQTGTPLRHRKDIVEFVAETVRREQASNCRFEIGHNSITYYYT
ncbi:MAG: hypothetical protein IPJ00_07360 [Saprospirales bacterium]|nr:hypothetical protein [Saprospirales bacterium]